MSGIDRATAQWYVDTALASCSPGPTSSPTPGETSCPCRRPDVEGANSVYALVVHCCGVMERWGGETIAGREIHRDRAAEFTATGTIDQAGGARRRPAAALGRGPRRLRRRRSAARSDGWRRATLEPTTQGFVVLHVIEELYQHLGHVDLTVDLVLGR